MNRRRSFRLLVIAALVVLAIPLGVTMPGVYGDGDDKQYTIPPKTPLKYPNLGYMLNQMVARVETREVSSEAAAREAPMHRGSSVAVTFYLSGNVAGVASFLEDNGGSPRNVGEDYIEAYVPVTLLGPASEQEGVLRVRAIVPPHPARSDAAAGGRATQADVAATGDAPAPPHASKDGASKGNCPAED